MKEKRVTVTLFFTNPRYPQLLTEEAIRRVLVGFPFKAESIGVIIEEDDTVKKKLKVHE